MARRRKRVLVLWNFVGDDVYVKLRETGPKVLPWDPTKPIAAFDTDEEEIQAIATDLRRAGYHAIVFNVMDDFGRLVGAIESFRPDVIFNLVELFRDDPVSESAVAGVYSLLGVPYTGNTPLCLATCQRKFRTKLLLDSEKIPTAPYRLVEHLPLPRSLGLKWPVIVKPAREDASGGVDLGAVVKDRAALEQRVRHVLQRFHQPALVEEYVEGREIHAGVFGNSPPMVLPLMELEWIAEAGREWQPRILSYKAKWDPTSPEFYAYREMVPARRLPAGVANRIRETAIAAYRVLGCRDYARVDFRVAADGTPYVLEVNPNPNLLAGTGYLRCAENAGISAKAALDRLVRMALARRPRPPRTRKKDGKKDGKKPDKEAGKKPAKKAGSKARRKGAGTHRG